MNTEQERSDFEAWANGRCELHLVSPAGRYSSAITQFAWEAYQAGRAALAAQPAASTEPVAWVAVDTLHSPHPGCVSSLAYMSQSDKDRGREYVPLYATPQPAEQQPAPDVAELVNDAERWRYVRQFLSLDDVGDEEFCLGLVVDYEGLESAVTPHAARLHAERCAAEWVVDADYVGDISPLPPVTVEQAIDAAIAKATGQKGGDHADS